MEQIKYRKKTYMCIVICIHNYIYVYLYMYIYIYIPKNLKE